MGRALNILMIEDNPLDEQLVLRYLKQAGYLVSHQRVESARALEAALEADSWDVIIADYRLPSFSALDALIIVQQRKIDPPFIIVSGTINEEDAVLALKAGAHDFVTKGNLARLGPAIERERREASERRLRRAAEAELIRHAARTAVLAGTAERLNKNLDQLAVMDAISRVAMEALATPTAGVFRYDRSRDAFTYWHAVGIFAIIGNNLQPIPRLFDDERGVYFIANAQQTFAGTSNGSLFRQHNLYTVITADLRRDGQLIGILGVGTIDGPRQFDDEDKALLKGLADQAAIALSNARLFSDLQHAKAALEQSYDATLEGWVRALELRDHETEGHTQRVTELTLRLARKMGISEEDLVHIRRGALLHDIGKMAVPDAILLKPGKLSQEEWAVMRQHPVHAYEWLRSVAFLQQALDIPYYHHERWDGSGYPHGLRGDQIPLAARIFAVIDVWDAMHIPRPYHSGHSNDEVRAYLRMNAGRLFDPQVVEAFFGLLDES